MYIITPKKNLIAKLSNPLPPKLEKEMQGKFVWTNPTNFKDSIELYKEQYMRIGVMREVCEAIRDHGLECEINYPTPSAPDFIWSSFVTHKALQEDLVLTGIRERFGFLTAPPGVGKTVCLTDIICKLGKKAVVITEAEEPFYGAYGTIREFSDIDVGRVGCGYHEPKDVTVCMLQTMRNRIKDIGSYPEIQALFNEAKVWITDEAHNCLSDSYGLLYDMAKNVEYFLGMSATPFTSSDKESVLYARIGPVIHEISYGEAVNNNLLVPFTCYIQKAPEIDYGYNKLDEKGEPIRYPSYIRNRQYSAVRKNYIVKNRERCEQYLHFTRTFIENGYSVAIIVAETEHGALFKEMYPDIVEVYGTTPKKRRKEIWEQLKKKEIMGVVTTLMDEATNIPSLDAVAIAAGGKSKVKLIQRLRNLRTFEGYTVNGFEKKEMGYVFITEDRADFVRSHSKLNIKHLKELARQHPACEVIKV